MEWKALEKIEGPVGGSRQDILAAMTAAMVVMYAGRKFERDPTFEQLVADFVLRLPWVQKPKGTKKR